MTRPIEAVVAEAQQRLAATGRLDVAAYVSAYPEHAAELQELLPVMLTLHQEKRWQAAEATSRRYALDLFADLAGENQEGVLSVGGLFSQEREEFNLSIEEQARRTGIPARALAELDKSTTPIADLDNVGIRALAQTISAPFGALLKEIRRLKSLSSMTMLSGGAVFTRDKETSSLEEQLALRNKVRNATRTPPEEK